MRYHVHAVADEHCDRINPDELIGETDDLAEALRLAETAAYPYGAAITDTETGTIDFGISADFDIGDE